ncbi:MAG: prepilin peptidase [Tissierellia bacterium]|jgi:Flp pilus assembly protein protease CpaA|nr:prepilin peptidase [Tissierellia bacterium]
MHFILLLIGLADMLWMRIPDELNGLLILIFLFKDPWGLPRAMAAFLFFSALYYLSFYLYSKEAFGYGDVKFFSVLFVGLRDYHLEFVFLSFLSAGVFSLFLLLLGRDKDVSFPLAPFMILSFLYYYK